MSTCNTQSMTNGHASLSISAIAGAVHLWRQRLQERRDLAHWSERDIRDAGFSVAEVMAEVDKPFWRS